VFTSNVHVSESARAAVLAAASEIGYRPRRKSATSLSNGLTTLGLLARSGHYIGPANPFYGPVLHGAQRVIAELGLSLVLEMVPDDYASHADDLPLVLQRRQAQGVVLVGHFESAYIKAILATGMPCVIVDHRDADLPIDAVVDDDERGGYEATKHLIDLGHRDPVPAFIGADAGAYSIAARLAGYRAALVEAGLRPDDAYERQGTLTPESGRAEMAALLELPRPPTAVFCVNDFTALGAIDLLRERGIAVPEQCSVVGYDDIKLAEYSVPPLTTIAVDKELLGMQAVWNLVERIRHPELQVRETRLRIGLTVRGSTAEKR
jgi:LacI family transcriptional regulator